MRDAYLPLPNDAGTKEMQELFHSLRGIIDRPMVMTQRKREVTRKQSHGNPTREIGMPYGCKRMSENHRGSRDPQGNMTPGRAKALREVQYTPRYLSDGFVPSYTTVCDDTSLLGFRHPKIRVVISKGLLSSEN